MQRTPMRSDKIIPNIDNFAPAEISATLVQFSALEAQWRAFAHQSQIDNGFRLLNGFRIAFLRAQTLSELVEKLTIFNRRARAPLKNLEEQCLETYKSGLELLSDQSALIIFSHLFDEEQLFNDEEEDEKSALAKIKTFAEYYELNQEQIDLLNSIRQQLAIIAKAKKINTLVFEIASCMKDTFETELLFDELAENPIPAGDQDALHSQLLKGLEASKQLIEQQKTVKEQIFMLLLDPLHEELQTVIIERMNNFLAESSTRFAQVNAYLASLETKFKAVMETNQAHAERLLADLIRLHHNPTAIRTQWDLIFREKKSQRIENFRRLAHLACEPRELQTEDFSSRAVTNKYQLKARLFLLYLSGNRLCRDLLGKGEDLDEWFSNPENLRSFTGTMTFLYSKLSRPNSSLTRETVATLGISANRFISQYRLPITPLQLFSPTLSYARTEAADAICQHLAGNLELQRFLLGHQGERALNLSELRAWLIENRACFISEEEDTAEMDTEDSSQKFTSQN